MKLEIPLIRLIYNILNEDVLARDNWMLTIKHIHLMEMKVKGISKKDYFDSFHNEELTNIRTIHRLWQKVQEDYPFLRGDAWYDRQKQGGQFSVDDFVSQTKLFSKEEMHDIATLKIESIQKHKYAVGNVYANKEGYHLVIIQVDEDWLGVKICDIDDSNVNLKNNLVPMRCDYFDYHFKIGNYVFLKKIQID
jgi:hypothetical protein